MGRRTTEATEPKARKQRTRKPTTRTRRPRAAKAENLHVLPPPVEPESALGASVQQEPEGVMHSLGNLFGSQRQSPKAESSGPSVISFASEPEMSAESARILASVPDSIADDSLPADDVQQTVGDAIDADPVAALMAQVAFETQDVQDALAELFDRIAERTGSDHWKLTERQARMLGGPTAQLLNSIWGKLQNYLPDIIARWCESTPGASAFILAAGLVVGPKVMQQVQISRQRASARPMVVPQQPKPQQQQPQPTHSTLVVE